MQHTSAYDTLDTSRSRSSSRFIEVHFRHTTINSFLNIDQDFVREVSGCLSCWRGRSVASPKLRGRPRTPWWGPGWVCSTALGIPELMNIYYISLIYEWRKVVTSEDGGMPSAHCPFAVLRLRPCEVPAGETQRHNTVPSR